jgi:3-oxoacyl-[acyl-carrier-protein] synthase III
MQDSEASGDASFGNVAMAGQDVFKFAVRSVPAVIEAALEQAGLEKEQVDWLVMHQANQRILDAAANRLGLPAERVSRGRAVARSGLGMVQGEIGWQGRVGVCCAQRACCD